MAERWTISGRVQRVRYRMSMVEEAQRLGLTGWVRNRADGSVEAHVQGTPGQLAALKEWARRGPPKAQVEDIASMEIPDEDIPDFVQLPTA